MTPATRAAAVLSCLAALLLPAGCSIYDDPYDKQAEAAAEEEEKQRRRHERAEMDESHRQFCDVADRWNEFLPCLTHRLIERAAKDADLVPLNKTEAAAADALLKAKLARLRARFSEAKTKEQYVIFHDWWCTRDKAVNAEAGSPLWKFCQNWAQWHKNNDPAGHGLNASDGENAHADGAGTEAKRHNAAMIDVRTAMLGQFCVGDRLETYGPCMKYALGKRKQVEELNESEVQAALSAIEEKVPMELGQKQFMEISDWWCGREVSKAAVAKSSLRLYCDGWQVFKQRKSEL